MDTTLWQAKLAAWTHDPAEKALVLLRDPAGHEGGTVAALRQDLFGAAGLSDPLRKAVQKADHWAAAADRPQWPRTKADGPYADWTQVRFTERPVLIHPLSGEEYDLGQLAEISAAGIKAVSADHFRQLVIRNAAGAVDARRTALNFWRFGPNTPAADLGALWELLPADTRVPDHTIWAHLDLSSALATAFHADPDGNPALLAVSFGPVQDFIAQARTTSDLWAGSHLLSRIAWEGLKILCEALGPDCVLFPQLRGVPQVDLWLRDEMGLPKERFANEEWTRDQTDANPLFAAALPNKFVAIVPASQAEELARRITAQVRDWTQRQANAALDRLLERVGGSIPDAAPAREQITRQLAGFPEVHWAAVPWSPLVVERERQAPEVASLTEALGHFYPQEPTSAPGFLGSPAWKLLDQALKLPDGTVFFNPNPGVLYPALYDLLDKVQAAAKAVREFQQLPQEGYRCSLCGEREWLTHDRDLLHYSPRQQAETLWAKVQDSAWARKGEHLCAPCALKRLWPNLFAQEIREMLEAPLSRYVVSTHTLALSTSLWNWMQDESSRRDEAAVMPLIAQMHGLERVALPKKLADALRHGRYPHFVRQVVECLPALLDQLRERTDADLDDDRLHGLAKVIEGVIGHKPETYYALIMMDGDRMGAWLSGTEPRYQLAYRETWHPQIRAGVAERIKQAGGDLARYPDQLRPVSPARHMAVSAALNSFALRFARYIVEDLGKGKLIYAGGDDVLAMISVYDLLPVMFLLRLAYSGVFPVASAEQSWEWLGGGSARLDIGRGHIRFGQRLFRVMGHKATASMGAVVAHHQAPLAYVLRKLRDAEKRAKNAGGRDAFAIDLLKRSGGAIQFTCPWLLPRDAEGHADWSRFSSENLETTPMGQLIRLRDRFAGQDFSRRAAYLTHGWLEDMPADPTALEAMLAYQFKRQTQSGKQDQQIAESLGRGLAQLAQAVNPQIPGDFVRDVLAVAEFLAREGRVGKKSGSQKTKEDAA